MDRLPKINCVRLLRYLSLEFVTKRNIVPLIHQDFCKSLMQWYMKENNLGWKTGHKKCKEMSIGGLLRTELKELSRDKNSN